MLIIYFLALGVVCAALYVGLRLLFGDTRTTAAEDMDQLRQQIEGWMYERAWDSRRTLEEFERRLDDRG